MGQKKFVIGDIHGRYKALKEVLKKAKFDYKKDKLIILGDVVDGGYNSYKVVEELLKIKNKIFIIGNHDEWFMNHIKTGWAEEIWLQQGGCNTLKSYGAEVKEADYITEESLVDTRGLNIPVTHQDFFNEGVFWHVEDEMMFVHGGFNPSVPMDKQEREVLLWDRSLIERMRNGKKTMWKKIFVGHTTTQTYGSSVEIIDCFKPIKFNNLIMMDTGAGWNGKLTIMNIKTEKYWQSKIQNPAT